MNNKDNDLEKTQEMPAITDETMLLPPNLRPKEKIYGERVIGQVPKAAAPRRWYRQAALYAAGFFIAVIMGYAAVNYLADGRELAENDQAVKQKLTASQQANDDKQAGISLADVQRTTKDYAIAVNDKKAELTDAVNKAQESMDEVKSLVDKTDALKKQADAVLAENEGVLAAVKQFFLEQRDRLQELFSQENPKK